MPKFICRPITVKDGIAETDTCIVADQDTLAIHPAATAYGWYLSSEKGRPLNTLTTYLGTVARFLTVVGSDPKLSGFEEVEDRHIRAFIERIVLEQKKLETSTANQYINHLEGFYNFAFERGFVNHRPRVYLSESTKRLLDEQKGKSSSLDPHDLPSQFTPKDEFEDLLSYVTAKRAYEAARDDIVLQLGYHSGLRTHEVTLDGNLTLRKILKAIERAESAGEDGFEIQIMGKGDKPREVFVPEQLKRTIVRFMSDLRKDVPGDLLICTNSGSELDAEHGSNVYRSAKNALLEAGSAATVEFWKLNDNKRSFHSLRHTFATNLADFCRSQGLSYQLLAERMGHEGEGRGSQTLTYIHYAAKKRGDKREADSVATQMLRSNMRAQAND